MLKKRKIIIGVTGITKTHILILLFLCFYMLISFLTYKDFGVTADEYRQKKATEDLSLFLSKPTSYESLTNPSYNYEVSNFSHPINTTYQRSYQLVQYILNPKGYYEWDHLINLLFGSLFFLSIYAIFYNFYKSAWRSMIPVILLVLTPRLVGHIPANNKDIPFAIMYLISLTTIYFTSQFKLNRYLKIIVIGTIFGFMQTFRAIGFSIYIVYIFYHLYLWFTTILEKNQLKKFNWKTINQNIHIQNLTNFFLELVIIGVFSMFVSILIFPWLGANVIRNLYELMLNTRDYENWNNKIFFNGEFLIKGNRPWYYLFTWILITTPISTLILWLGSLFYFGKLIKNKIFILMWLAFIVNIILYLILQPTIYNGLRHFIFLLPIIIIIAGIFLIYLLTSIKKSKIKYAFFILILANLILVANSLISLHPYQYIYFNETIGGLRGAQNRYELDYWGASYKEATQWLIKNVDLVSSESVYPCNIPYSVMYYSKQIFTIGESPNTADYIICDSENLKLNNYDGEVIHEIKRHGVTINTIIKTKRE